MNTSRRRRALLIAGLCGAVAALVTPRVVAAQEAAPELGPAELAERPIGRLIREGIPKLRRLRSELALTPAQWQEIRGVLNRHDAELREVGKRLREQHREVAEASRVEPLDEARLRATVAELTPVLADAAVLKAKVWAEIKTKLTTEQQETLRTFRQEMEVTIDRILAGPAR